MHMYFGFVCPFILYCFWLHIRTKFQWAFSARTGHTKKQHLNSALDTSGHRGWHRDRHFLSVAPCEWALVQPVVVSMFKGVQYGWNRRIVGSAALHRMFSTHTPAKSVSAFRGLERRKLLYFFPSSIISLTALQHILLQRPKAYNPCWNFWEIKILHTVFSSTP